MDENPMSGMDSLVTHRLGVADRKREELAQASQDKKNKFNPLNIENVEHVDGDTFKFKDTQQSFRVQSDPSFSVDTYESHPDAYDPSTERGRQKFENHRRNYAKLTGKPEWTITRNELLERGRVQSEQTRARMQELGAKGLLDFQVNGVDQDGRALVTLRDKSTGQNFFADHSGREQNAAYDNKYNAGQQLKDFFSGQTGEDTRFTGSRSFKDMLTDQPTNLVAGAGRMLTDLAQAGTVLADLNGPGTDNLFRKAREGLDNFQSRFTSNEQQGRQRLAEKNRARATELYNYRKQEYINAGDSETEAKIKAGIGEFGDSIKSLLVNPGRILDATVESLPYMIGVGAVGAKVATKASQVITKRTIREVVEAGGTELMGKASAARFLESTAGRQMLRRITTATGATTVGITEGLTNGAEVYQRIIDMTPEEAMESEKYRELRETGVSHGTAVRALAEEAAVSTMATTAALSAAAALVTGAGGFEARLFTGKADLPKKVASAAATTAVPAKKTLTGKALSATGSAAKTFAKPGGKEALEESIQSGGGEFLSQLASLEATGQEVGPGVGGATAEGAVVGFASGGGFGSVRQLALNITEGAKNRNKNTSGLLPGTSAPNLTKGPINAVGKGEIDRVLRESAKTGKDYNFVGSLQSSLVQVVEKGKKDPESVSLQEYENLTRLHSGAVNSKQEIPADVQAGYDLINSHYESALAQNVTRIADKKEPLTEGDIAVINAAASRNVIPEAAKAKLPENVQRVLKHSADINNLMEEAKELEVQAVAAQSTEQGKRTLAETYANKFGDKIGANNKPGLEWYRREMTEIMADPEKDQRDSQFLKLSKDLKAFITSQDKKIAQYKLAAEQQKDVGNVKYKPQVNGKGGTQGLYETLLRERVLMDQVRQGLVQQFNSWHPKASESIQAEANPTPFTEPTLNAAPETAAQATTTAPESSEAPTKAPEKPVEAKKEQPAKKAKEKKAPLTLEEVDPEAETAEGGIDIPVKDAKTAKKKATKKAAKKAPVMRDRINNAVGNVRNLSDSQLEALEAAIEKEYATGPENADLSNDGIALRDVVLNEMLRREVNAPEATESGLVLEEATDDDVPGIDLGAPAQTSSNPPGDSGAALENSAEAQPNAEGEQSGGTQQPTTNTLSRLSDATDLLAYLNATPDAQVADLVLTNKKDNALLQEQLAAGITPDAAIAAVINAIEPDPNKRQGQVQSNVPEEQLNAFLAASEQLNVPKGSTAAAPFSNFWQNFASPATASLERLKGVFLGSRNMPTENVLEAVNKKFKELGLPTSLREAFRRRSKKTKSLFSALPDVMAVLTDGPARRKLAQQLKLSPAEKKALDVFAAFYPQFAKALKDNYRKLDFSKPWVGQQLIEHPIHYFENENGELDPNVVGPMALEAMLWLATSGPQTLWNDYKGINALLGRDENHPVTREEYKVLGSVGTLRNGVANDLGTAIFAHLNLSEIDNPGIRDLFEDQLPLVLGGAAIGALTNMKRISLQSVSDVWFQAAKDGRLDTLTDKEKAELRKKTSNNSREQVVSFIRNKTDSANDDVNQELRKALHSGHGVFSRLFGANPLVRMPSITMPTTVPANVQRSVSGIPEAMRERMLSMTQRAWKANTNVMSILSRLNPEAYLRMAHEYVTDFSTVHDELKDAVEGRNRALKRDFVEALDWFNTYGDKDFFFEYAMSRAGRVNINSNVINPQSSKLHRFMFGMNEWTVDVPTDTSSRTYENFLISVALGLGISVDKLSRKEVLRLAQERVDSKEMEDVRQVLNKEGEISPEDMEVLGVFLHHESKLGGEGTHTLAALVAWNQWKNASLAGDATVAVDMPMETDGITNGFIAGALQTPPKEITEEFKAMLRAGGVFFIGDPFQNFAQFVASGQKDNYQQIAEGVQKYLKEMLEKTFDTEEATNGHATARKFIQDHVEHIIGSGLMPNLESLGAKEGRNWAKNPLMVVSYGSSINSVVRKIVDDAIDKFHTNLAKATTLEELSAVMNSAYKIANVALAANRKGNISIDVGPKMQNGKRGYYNVSPEVLKQAIDKNFDGDLRRFAREFVLEGDALQLFRQGINQSYGVALEKALNEKIAPLTEIRKKLNHANKLMNLIFLQDFQRRLETLQKLRGSTLGPDDRLQIYRDMYKEGVLPSVQTALANKNIITESLETTEYTVDYLGGADNAVKTLFNKEIQLIEKAFLTIDAKEVTPAKMKSFFNQLTSRKPSTDVGVAAVVKLIQSLDGVNNSYAWGRHPILNIHDAQVGSFETIDQVAKEVNQEFFNMHRNYNLPAEMFAATLRMTSLLSVNDSRLPPSAKNKVYSEFMDHLVRFGYMTKAEAPKAGDYALMERIFREFMQELRTDINDSTASKETLFNTMSWISQFSKDGAEYAVPQGEQGETLANPSLSSTASLRELMLAAKSDIVGFDAVQQAATIASLKAVLDSKKSMNKPLRDYIRESNPSGKELLDTLQAVYRGHPAGSVMRLLNNMMAPFLKNTRVQVGQVSSGASSQYSNNTVIIGSRSTNTVRDIMHELVHAATVGQLEALAETSPDTVNQLFRKAMGWAAQKAKPNFSKNATEQLVAMQILQYRRTSKINAVSEYLAYSLTESTADKDYSLLFAVDGQNRTLITELFTDLFQALRNPDTGTNTLFSTGRQTDRTLFEDKYTVLESQKMQQIFDDLAALDQNDMDLEHRSWLQNVLDTFVIPGIQSLEVPLQQEIAKAPYANEHIGEAQGDKIRLQAAGNKLSSNVDMSLQETALHEYVHGITKAAIDGDPAIRAEAVRLFNLARASIKPADFLPPVIVGDPAIAMAKAQERYDYIFENGAAGYHEFIAIAMTNKPFATALSKLSNREVVKPVWGAGILNGILELFRRAVVWVTGQSVGNPGATIESGVQNLVRATIAQNQKNIQRIWDIQQGKDPDSMFTKAHNVVVGWNDTVAQTLSDKLVDPLLSSLEKRATGGLDPNNPTFTQFAKSATYVALKTRDDNVRTEFNKFYRKMGGSKDNWFFEVANEIVPWNSDNLGTPTADGWMDLLRKSKVIVDMARQNIAEHTRAYLNKSFDKKNPLSQPHKEAITRVMLKTDLSSLMNGEGGLDTQEVFDLLTDPNKRDAEEAKLTNLLSQELADQNANQLMNMFTAQTNSLAYYMVHGVMRIEHGMQNAHNIVHQFNLTDTDRTALQNTDKLISLVDRIATVKALQMTPPGDIQLTLDMANHEMALGKDNGFERLLGMHINFKELAKEHLFDDQPVQMIKGYVYEIFDGDVNIEFVDDTPEEHARMLSEGMILVGKLGQDPADNRRPKVLYKGLKGLSNYNKSIVSLTDMAHRGAELFDTQHYRSKANLLDLANMKSRMYQQTKKNHFKPGHVRVGNNLVPVLNNAGEIVDYRYVMSEANKQKLLKKADPFDKVLPRMFASITDRNSSKDINSRVVDLLWDEWDKLGDGKSEEHSFVEVGRFSKNPAAKEMYNLLPGDMQRLLKKKFGGEKFYIRDDVVNLVMGFRKMSISNLGSENGTKPPLWGKYAPIVRMAEKYWQEVVNLMRIKIAILTPAVVVSNVASNSVMLLAEGIHPDYIRRKSGEAIAAMRAYQKDVRTRDELRIDIGSNKALGKDVRSKMNEYARLTANIEANPVGQLVEQGLFTSIAEDLGAADDSIRDNLINKGVDKIRGIVPGPVITGVKELYMLPGTTGYRAAVKATQYGDFVARYVMYSHDTQVKKMGQKDAINKALASFIYYDIPQSKYLQYLNDTGFLMFTKFFLRIQPIVARMYTQNPATAFGYLALQQALLPKPFNENIIEYGMGSGLTHKPEINPVGKAGEVLDPTEPSLLKWLLGPFGL